jgi:hypothetical protein
MTKKKEEVVKTISKKIYYKSPSSGMIKEVFVNRESKTYFSYFVRAPGRGLFTIPKCCVMDDLEGRLAYLEQELCRLQNRVYMYEHKHTLLGKKI